MMIEHLLVLCARAFIAIILLASGIGKLMGRPSFAEIVRGFALVPEKFVSIFAAALPPVECATGCCLMCAAVLPFDALRFAAVIALGLFGIFGLAISINLVRGRRNVECGCFGTSKGDMISWSLVLRNCLFGVVGYIAFLRGAKSSFTDGSIVTRGQAVFVAVAVILTWLLLRALVRLLGYGAPLNDSGGRR